MIGKTNSKQVVESAMEFVNVQLSTNQSSHQDILGAKVIVSYGTYTNEYEWNGDDVTFTVPAQVGYTVSFGDVEDYKTPSSVTFSAVDDNARTIEAVYETEIVSVDLSATDGSSLDGAVVTINGKSQTWEDTTLTQKVAYGTVYSVVAGALDGYVTPSAQTNITANRPSRSLSFSYVASSLTVNILSNQGTDAAIASVKATVSYGSTSVEVSSGQVVNIPSGSEVTISFPEVEGYKKPEDITFTHNGGAIVKSGTYQCELLTVNVSADSGSVSGFEVTISKQETVGVATKYTRLEYIEGNGSQYLDTGITPSDDLEVEISFKPTSAVSEGAIFGSDWSTNGYFLMYYNSKWRFHTRGYVFDSSTSIDASGFTVIKTATSSITINGSKSTWTKGTTSDSSSNIWLLYCDGTYSAKKYGYGQVAYMKMWKGGTLVRDYIPALRSDGIAGLYDAVNDTFYASNGSSNFTAGSKSEEIIVTQTSVTGSYKIPFDTSYIVQANSISGYDKPSPISRVASQKSYTASQKYTLITLRDLSLFDVYGNPIQRSTANCYVIREAGTYKFPLVRGNAIKNGQVNTAAFTNNGGSYSHDFVDSSGEVITSPYISPTSVYIDNADCDNVISDLQLVEGDECGFVQFKVNQIPASGGNIIIGVNGGLYEPDTWSWHLWLWPHDLTPVEITNSTGVKYNIMPVNLASKYDSDGVHIKNWFYQWGRKDPMLLPSAWNSTTDHSPGSIDKTAKTGVLTNSLTFPSTFYYNSPTGSMGIQTIWFDSTKYYNLWDAACSSLGSSDNDTVKTVYDPCPVGWKVPNGNVFTGMSEISYNDGIYKLTRYSGDTTGVTIHANTCRNYYDGNINAGGECHLLTSAVIYSTGAYQANSLRLNGGYIYSSNGTYMASGESIRPVEDDIFNTPGIVFSFSIYEKTYQAETGMTWSEWCNSDYNTDGYYLDEDNIVRDSTYYVTYEGSSNEYFVKGNIFIVGGFTYGVEIVQE